MIKANELRIGNKIKIGNVISTVTGGHLDYCGDKTEVKEFYPIPLTPEILEKAEFTGTIFPAQLSISNTGKYYWGNGVNIELKYLHQLQNLYFALTGEELVIKEETPA